MLLLDPGAGEFTSEQAHLKGQHHALLPGHRTMDIAWMACAAGIVSLMGHGNDFSPER
jgi:hypothetical protein